MATCKNCGQTGLEWRNNGGRWSLVSVSFSRFQGIGTTREYPHLRQHCEAYKARKVQEQAEQDQQQAETRAADLRRLARYTDWEANRPDKMAELDGERREELARLRALYPEEAKALQK